MIYALRGQVFDLNDTSVVIDCAGVSYEVIAPQTVLDKVPAIGEDIQVYTYHHIREDAMQLYGFLSTEDKRFFLLLTGVSGVGPKVGIKIMSSIPVGDFVSAIINGDLAVLTSVSGVGKKMAERIIVELKDKLPSIYGDGTVSQSSNKASTALQNSVENDLVLALKTLGYKSDEIKRAIQAASSSLSDDISLDQGIKILLKYL